MCDAHPSGQAYLVTVLFMIVAGHKPQVQALAGAVAAGVPVGAGVVAAGVGAGVGGGCGDGGGGGGHAASKTRVLQGRMTTHPAHQGRCASRCAQQEHMHACMPLRHATVSPLHQ